MSKQRICGKSSCRQIGQCWKESGSVILIITIKLGILLPDSPFTSIYVYWIAQDHVFSSPADDPPFLLFTQSNISQAAQAIFTTEALHAPGVPGTLQRRHKLACTS